MIERKITNLILTAIILSILSTGCIAKKEEKAIDNTKPEITTTQKHSVTKPKPIEKKYDLYSNTPYDIPLYSITEISKLPTEIKTIVDKILEQSQGFYFLKFDGEKVFIILQNPITSTKTFSRQNLQLIEIDLQGNISYHNAGYIGVEGEISDFIKDKKLDNWVLDNTEEYIRLLKHIAYDEKNNIKFTELWNYDENEPFKYQMLDSNNKTISILKETQESDSNYRKEHIFYDNNGNTTMSLTINYDGANISRLTFFNSHDSIDSVSILSEYTDGIKTKELVYDQDYKLISSFIPEYIDGERKKIKIYFFVHKNNG
jgi:hypothetical protein